MTTAPERVRRAIKATAEQITADSIPPFRVPARRFAGQPRTDGRGWPRWLAPVAAAVSMAIIAAAILVVSNASHQRPAGPIGAVPPYYAAVTLESSILHRPLINAITIRATATGQVLATVRSQAPHFVFDAVSGAADDRTFVAAAMKPLSSHAPPSATAPVRFYLLRFFPAAHTVLVTELPIRNVTDQASIALSPDGRHLAVITDSFHGIRVYSVRTGARQSWVTPAGQSWVTSRFNTLLGPSWAPDNRTLAFFADPLALPSPLVGVHLLDTTSHKRSLLSASRQLRVPRRAQCDPPYLLAQESTIVCTIMSGRVDDPRGFIARISLRTGKVLQRLDLPRTLLTPLQENSIAPPEVAWAGRPGAPVIVLANRLWPRPYGSVGAYLLTSSGVTKLPGATWLGELSAPLTVAW